MFDIYFCNRNIKKGRIVHEESFLSEEIKILKKE